MAVLNQRLVDAASAMSLWRWPTGEAGAAAMCTSIARRLLNCGGTVKARSEGIGCGAEFHVALPKHRPSAVAVETACNPSGGQHVHDGALAGKQVLVIDDDADAREVMKLVLCHYGADVLTAESAEKRPAHCCCHIALTL